MFTHIQPHWPGAARHYGHHRDISGTIVNTFDKVKIMVSISGYWRKIVRCAMPKHALIRTHQRSHFAPQNINWAANGPNIYNRLPDFWVVRLRCDTKIVLANSIASDFPYRIANCKCPLRLHDGAGEETEDQKCRINCGNSQMPKRSRVPQPPLWQKHTTLCITYKSSVPFTLCLLLILKSGKGRGIV